MNWTLCSQSSPSSDTGMVVRGCWWIQNYQYLQTSTKATANIQYNLPVFPHPCLCTGDFNSPHDDKGYNNNGADEDSLVTWANSNNLALL